jgi:hypothetical protein
VNIIILNDGNSFYVLEDDYMVLNFLSPKRGKGIVGKGFTETGSVMA